MSNTEIKDVVGAVTNVVDSAEMRVPDDGETVHYLGSIPSLEKQEEGRQDRAARNKRTLLSEGTPETDKIMENLWGEARCQTLETLPKFLNKLQTEYQHDYGTICKALAMAAVGSAWAMDRGEQGGITGFQSGAVMWEFIRAWTGRKTPARLIDYGDMLYPQCADKFAKTITRSVFAELQRLAGERLAKKDYAHPDVRAHWQSIVDGVVPFGYMLAND